MIENNPRHWGESPNTFPGKGSHSSSALSFIFLTGLLVSFLCACQREIEDIPQGPEVPQNTDCRLKRLEQGEDTILTLHYNNDGLISKVVDYDKPSDYADSVLATYNSAGKLMSLFYDCPFASNVDFAYHGDTLIRFTNVTDNWTEFDTTVYEFIYVPNQAKPVRVNLYSYDFVTHGLWEYELLTYDSEGDLVHEEIYSADDTLYQTYDYTYTDLPNSFKQIGIVAGIFNLYDPINSMFYFSWMNTHNLATKTVTYQSGDIEHYYLNYEQDSTGRVTAMQSIRNPGSAYSDTFHYKLFYECP